MATGLKSRIERLEKSHGVDQGLSPELRLWLGDISQAQYDDISADGLPAARSKTNDSGISPELLRWLNNE